MNVGRKTGETTTAMGVALCCSYADLAFANEIRQWLEDRGIVSDLVPDVDRDDAALVVQLMGDEGPTVYVLLASSAFSSDRVQTLVREFGARRGPTHRLQIVEPGTDSAEEIADVVARAVHTSARRTSRVDVEAVGTAKRQTGVPALQRRSPGSPIVPRRARVKEDPNPLRDRVGVIPSSIRTFGAAPGAVRRALSDDNTKKVEPSAGVREQDTTPMRAPVVSGRTVPAPSASRPPLQRTTPRDVLVDLAGAVPDAAPLVSDALVPPAEEVAVPDAQTAELTPRRRPTGRVGLAVAGAVAIAAAATLAWIYDSDRAEVPPNVPVVRASVGEPVPSTPVPTPSEPEGPVAAAGDRGGVAPDKRAAQILPTPAANVGAAAAQPPRAVLEGPDGAAAEAQPVPAADGDSEGVLDADGDDDAGAQADLDQPEVRSDPSLADKISAALDAGRIRALDNMLFFRARVHDDVAFADAEALCRRASINHIRGWRLSTILELRQLRKARIIPRSGAFWSRSRAETTEAESDAYWTISRASHRPAAMSADEPVAQTVCVRAR